MGKRARREVSLDYHMLNANAFNRVANAFTNLFVQQTPALAYA